MKNILFAVVMLFSTAVLAQTGNAKVDELLAKMRQGSNGKITYTINGKTVSEGILVVKDDAKKQNRLMGDPIKTNVVIACSFPVQSGEYTFGGKNDWLLGVGNTPNSIGGTAKISISGNKVSATFVGDVFVPDGKGKFSKKSSGTTTGSFTASL